MRELWLPVPGYPLLLASSEGRVMMRPKLQKMPNGGSKICGGTPTKGYLGAGRMIWRACGKTHKVARLVCTAFKGIPQDAKSVVMHIDENAMNNHFSNLAWGSQKENLNAPGFIAYCKSRTGEKNPFVKSKNKLAGGQ